MDVTVSGRKMPVSDSLKNYANEKIAKTVEQMEVGAISCDIVLYREKNPSNPNPAICEVTVMMKGHVARAEESEQDMFAAIDIAGAKIARQLRKFKTRLNSKRVKKTDEAVSIREAEAVKKVDNELDLDALMADLSDDEIIRRKQVEYTPMTEDDALVQIDLLGHDFFIYTDRDSNEVHVIYRRSNGGYGVISPKDAEEAK